MQHQPHKAVRTTPAGDQSVSNLQDATYAEEIHTLLAGSAQDIHSLVQQAHETGFLVQFAAKAQEGKIGRGIIEMARQSAPTVHPLTRLLGYLAAACRSGKTLHEALKALGVVREDLDGALVTVPVEVNAGSKPAPPRKRPSVKQPRTRPGRRQGERKGARQPR
jgi:hypothetical protein